MGSPLIRRRDRPPWQGFREDKVRALDSWNHFHLLISCWYFRKICIIVTNSKWLANYETLAQLLLPTLGGHHQSRSLWVRNIASGKNDCATPLLVPQKVLSLWLFSGEIPQLWLEGGGTSCHKKHTINCIQTYECQEKLRKKISKHHHLWGVIHSSVLEWICATKIIQPAPSHNPQRTPSKLKFSVHARRSKLLHGLWFQVSSSMLQSSSFEKTWVIRN